MTLRRTKLLFGGFALSAAAFLTLTATIAQEPAAQEPTEPKIMLPEESKALKQIAASEAIYVGASKCKSCHNKDAYGKIYDKWGEMKHSHALEGLKTDEAIALGKELGIEKPWEEDSCLKCHITAYEEPKERRHKRFKMDKGVQCETCHGPGSIHVKTRLAEAKAGNKLEGLPMGVPASEIVMPDEGLCRSCHNDESPSFEEFDYAERLEKIRHMHPLRKEPRVKAPEKKEEGAEGAEEASK